MRAAESDDSLLSTGDMARITGNTLRTVRFYEEAGILRPERRSTGGHRLFGRSDLERLRLITDLRAAGLSLDEIRDMLELKERSRSAVTASTAVLDAVDRQLTTLETRIAALTRLRDELTDARAHLLTCRSCTDTGFPEACGGCEKLPAKSVPVAMRVLWGIKENDG